jgi:programmed cell death protein 4
MSLDKSYRERELVSQFFSIGYPDVLSTNIIGKGFERLFELIDELEKDVPSAKDDVSIFLARCVIDEVLPPAFLSDVVVCNLGGEIVEHAKKLLSREHGGAKLEHIWGPGDGRPVEAMKIAIDQLLQEYLLSRQLDEANRCIRELNAPHFHHEIVKRAVTQALDKPEEQRQAMSSMLSYLVAEDVISHQQVLQGFRRVNSLVPELMLDTPSAPVLVAEFVARAIQDGILPADFNNATK